MYFFFFIRRSSDGTRSSILLKTFHLLSREMRFAPRYPSDAFNVLIAHSIYFFPSLSREYRAIGREHVAFVARRADRAACNFIRGNSGGQLGFARRVLFPDNTSSRAIYRPRPRLALTDASNRVHVVHSSVRSLVPKETASSTARRRRCVTVLPGMEGSRENSKLNPAEACPGRSLGSPSCCGKRHRASATHKHIHARTHAPSFSLFPLLARSMGNRVIDLSRSSVPAPR